jgi:hypothetical protein
MKILRKEVWLSRTQLRKLVNAQENRLPATTVPNHDAPQLPPWRLLSRSSADEFRGSARVLSENAEPYRA